MTTGESPYELRRGNYTISTDPNRLDLELIHGYLERSYWGAGRPREVVARSLRGSLCFGVYHERGQVGLARIVTDGATFAWLCDVFVLEEHRGGGLGKWLIGAVMDHPQLRDIRRIILATRDAHGLYRLHGFAPLAQPDLWMERRAS
jgi:GNAT superfamily N-acetyltransferase